MFLISLLEVSETDKIQQKMLSFLTADIIRCMNRSLTVGRSLGSWRLCHCVNQLL